MTTRALALVVAAMLLTTVAIAAPKTEVKKAMAKAVNVMVCPMTGEAVTAPGGGKSVVGNYTVNFCCPSCKPGFDKLPKAQKLQKIQAALKKQDAAKKGKKADSPRPFRLMRVAV